jgi:hypothetical protein
MTVGIRITVGMTIAITVRTILGILIIRRRIRITIEIRIVME